MGYSCHRGIFMPSIDVDQDLRDTAKAGDMSNMRDLLARGANPRSQDARALELAAENGHVECVELLLEVSDAKEQNSLALRLAAENGHAECVKVLLPASDAKAEEFLALRWAVEKGYEEY